MAEGAAGAGTSLRQVLDLGLREAATRPLADVLRTVVRELVRLVDCRRGAIAVGTPDGRTECFVTAGDATLADTLFGPPSSAADPISDVAAEAVAVRVPADEDDTPARIGVPILLRGRAAGGCYLGRTRGRGRLRRRRPDPAAARRPGCRDGDREGTYRGGQPAA